MDLQLNPLTQSVEMGAGFLWCNQLARGKMVFSPLFPFFITGDQISDSPCCFTHAHGPMLLGKCVHTNTPSTWLNCKVETGKHTERYSKSALAACADELERKGRKTPANTCWLHRKAARAQQASPHTFSALPGPDVHLKCCLSVFDVQEEQLISMLGCSEVWATTICLDFFFETSGFRSLLFSSAHYLDVSVEAWSKYGLMDHLSQLITCDPARVGKKSTKVLEKWIKTYQGTNSSYCFNLSVYLWDAGTAEE